MALVWCLLVRESEASPDSRGGAPGLYLWRGWWPNHIAKGCASHAYWDKGDEEPSFAIHHS